MKDYITKLLNKELTDQSNKIFLCIGSSRCIGDSLGPMVGERLRVICNKHTHVIGTLNQNLNYSNICNTLSTIYNKIDSPYFILIDSALSSKEYVGNIVINKKKMKIGNSLEKSLILSGNISIKGIVGENKNDIKENLKNLNNVNEEIIKKLSCAISNQIIQALKV